MFSSIIGLSVFLPLIALALPLEESTCSIPHIRLTLGNHDIAQKEYVVPLFSSCDTSVVNSHPIQTTQLNPDLTTLTSFSYDLTELVDDNNNPFPHDTSALSSLLALSQDHSIKSVIPMINCSILIEGNQIARLTPLDATRKGGLLPLFKEYDTKFDSKVPSVLCSVEPQHVNVEKRNAQHAPQLVTRFLDITCDTCGKCNCGTICCIAGKAVKKECPPEDLDPEDCEFNE